MYTLTPSGLKKIESYIEEIKAKRKEILDAGKDTASSCRIPTSSEIFEDIVQEGFDNFDEARSEWAVTDHYSMEKAISLKLGEDVYEGNSIKKEKETEDLSWRNVSSYENKDGYIQIFTKDKTYRLDMETVSNLRDCFDRVYFKEDLDLKLKEKGYSPALIPKDLSERMLDRYAERRGEEDSDSGVEYPSAWFEIMNETIGEFQKELKPYTKTETQKMKKGKTI